MPIARIFDSHVHFIDPDRHRHAWMADAPEFRRRFLPKDYRAATVDLPITDLIFCEAVAEIGQCLDEVEWVDGLRRDEPRLSGIIARVPLTDPKRRVEVLEWLRAKKIVVGIRDIIQWEPAGYCTQRAYIEGVKLAASLGFPVELCIFHRQLPDLLALVKACPEARFMLNHCAKPGIKAGLLEPWKSQLRELAAHANVRCKISALLSEAGAGWTPQLVLPYVEHALACFGPRRVLYGSDWPMLTDVGAYRDWLSLTETATDGWSAEDRDRFYYANAREFYRLTA